MTCIVAIKDPITKSLLIAGDSIGVDSESMSKVERLDGKVFRKQDMLFGFTTSFRMGQILQYQFDLPEYHSDGDAHQYMVRKFIPCLLDQFEADRYLKYVDSVASGGDFIVAFDGNIFVVESDFQVGHVKDFHYSIGCGGEYALGSMHTYDYMSSLNFETTEASLRFKAKLALDAAKSHSIGVGGDYHYEYLNRRG